MLTFIASDLGEAMAALHSMYMFCVALQRCMLHDISVLEIMQQASLVKPEICASYFKVGRLL
jgi:hypothetical protein